MSQNDITTSECDEAPESHRVREKWVPMGNLKLGDQDRTPIIDLTPYYHLFLARYQL